MESFITMYWMGVMVAYGLHFGISKEEDEIKWRWMLLALLSWVAIGVAFGCLCNHIEKISEHPNLLTENKK